MEDRGRPAARNEAQEIEKQRRLGFRFQCEKRDRRGIGVRGGLNFNIVWTGFSLIEKREERDRG